MLNSEKLIDRLLPSKQTYKNMNARRPALYLGILLIGLIDILGFNPKAVIPVLFAGKAPGVTIYNISLFILFVIILGILDTVFFSIPLLDFFNVLREKKDEPYPAGLKVRFMKVYVLAHLITLPANILVWLAVEYLGGSIGAVQAYFLWLVNIAVIIWFTAVIARGVYVFLKLKDLYRWVVFPAVVLWSMLLSFALTYITDNWIMVLFK
jgi:hypothetical protein